MRNREKEGKKEQFIFEGFIEKENKDKRWMIGSKGYDYKLKELGQNIEEEGKIVSMSQKYNKDNKMKKKNGFVRKGYKINKEERDE